MVTHLACSRAPRAVQFLCCIMFKIATLTALPEVYERMSPEQKLDFAVPSVALGIVLLVSILGALVISFAIFAVQARAARTKPLGPAPYQPKRTRP